MNDPQAALRETLRSMGARPVLDGVGARKPVFDAAAAVATGGSYVEQDVRLKAVAAVHEWVETDDLDSDEGACDRLMALLIGVADADQNGELDEDEQAVAQMAMGGAWDYMASKGVSEDDLTLCFDSDSDDEANGAAERMREFLAGALPDGEDAAQDDMNTFAFGADAQAAVFDAAYKAKFAVRGGKKVRLMKRVSGSVRLSAKQKVAVRKMLMKSHGAAAQMHRLKSMNLGRRMGLHGK